MKALERRKGGFVYVERSMGLSQMNTLSKMALGMVGVSLANS